MLVIGDVGTGKTSIIKRYVHQYFSTFYKATIGADMSGLKVIEWDDETTIRLQLWDIAGQERFGNLTRVYYKHAVGALVVFDVTRAATFEAVEKWKIDLDSKIFLSDESHIPAVLLANKCDLVDEDLYKDTTQLDEFSEKKGFARCMKTSAQENVGIDDAVTFLLENILKNAESDIINAPQLEPKLIVGQRPKRGCCYS